jgi:CPA1 family monovalent cation:H+ antiporter
MALQNVMGEAAIQENLKQFLLVLSVSLSVASLSRFFTGFREIPYTLLLVIVGLFLALLDVRLIELSPEVTLFIFLPPLLFKTAWQVRWSILKQNLVPILFFSIGGSFIAIASVTYALEAFAGLSLEIALFAGASLAATSPTPVVSLFRQLGVNQRITTLTEGENLFSSCIAIATFVLLMESPFAVSELAVPTALVRIFLFLGLGFGIGSFVGVALSYLISHSDAPFLARSLLLTAAYGTYIATEEVGGSGVVAVVTAGLILGNLGSRKMASAKRQTLTEFLNFIAFFVNSIVFLLIGDRMNLSLLADDLLPIIIAIVTVLIARAFTIYGLGTVGNWLSEIPVTWQEQTLLWWVGLRGSVSIALALSVPVVYMKYEVIGSTVFGVVLFTLLVQGLTTKSLLSSLGFLESSSQREKYLQAIARSVALNHIASYLDEERIVQQWGNDVQFAQYREVIQQQIHHLQEEIIELQEQNPELKGLGIEQLRRELIAMESDIYTEFFRAGLLTKHVPPMLPKLLPNQS